jgi:hypothetical protein
MGLMPPTPSGVARQRSMTAAAGLGVAALAGLAFALSYDDLRLLALTGGAARRYAPLYPAMADTLVVVTIVSLVVARHTRWWVRAVRWLLLFVLLAGGAAAGTQRAVKGYDPLWDTWLSAGVAVAPWLLLLIAVWLWLAMFKQVKVALAAQPGTAGGAPPHPLPAEPERVTTEPDDDPGQSAASLQGPADTSLPTDVMLVGRPPAESETTQPDLVIPALRSGDPTDEDSDEESGGKAAPDTNADVERETQADAAEDDDVERWSALAAEDAERWAAEAAENLGGGADRPGRPPGADWPPPASEFRSSPTPPRD